ncbi:hypothetical protein BT96DRAFT_1006386 [Gymnopus androsaceus JB14]|uniref:Uncharacterized protein n=1 Tax=Gymnopus androsaceus JB14 TaxID=1447944 RepID=A0A6A4GLE0_9AGAR|nr:hypothetical protein BT96DRAFT_1006386 [Gymnopus androsaceus JB14]
MFNVLLSPPLSSNHHSSDNIRTVSNTRYFLPISQPAPLPLDIPSKPPQPFSISTASPLEALPITDNILAALLELLGPQLLRTVDSVTAEVNNASLPKELAVIVNDLTATNYPMHMLAIYAPLPKSASQASIPKTEVKLYPVPALLMASHCARLGPFPPSPTTDQISTPASNPNTITLPVCPMCLPSPETFPPLKLPLPPPARSPLRRLPPNGTFVRINLHCPSMSQTVVPCFCKQCNGALITQKTKTLHKDQERRARSHAASSRASAPASLASIHSGRAANSTTTPTTSMPNSHVRPKSLKSLRVQSAAVPTRISSPSTSASLPSASISASFASKEVPATPVTSMEQQSTISPVNTLD